MYSLKQKVGLVFRSICIPAGICLVSLALPADLGAKNYLPERDKPVPPDQEIPTVDFFRPGFFSDPELNPSGTHFAAFTKSESVASILVICDLATGRIRSSNSGITRFGWVDDSHLLLNNRWNGVINIARPQRQLMVSEVLPKDARGLDRRTGFMWQWPIDDRPMDSRRGSYTTVLARLEDGMPWICSTLEDDGRRHLYRRSGNRWVECPVDMDEIVLVALGDQPDEAIVIGPATKGSPRALQRLNLVSGELGEVLYRDATYDCLPRVYLKRDTRKVAGVYVPTAAPRTVWLDERMKEVQEMVDRQFQGKVVSIESNDIKESKFLIEVESDRETRTYLMLDHDRKALSLVKRVEPWLDPVRMSRMQALQYEARDGAAIEGYLVLPEGASKEKPAPMIVDIHAGPWGYRHTWGMSHTAQFFASRGYAVFQPNYRGSIGYDSRFEKADLFDFQKMSNDVVDGVRALEKSGFIDPAKIAVMGVGFGAYLAMCGAVDEPDLYRCAMIYGGIYDWEKLFRMKDSPSMLQDQFIERRLREFNLTPPSPMRRKDAIRTPLFMTRNVNIRDATYETQIFEFYLAMRKQVPCEFFGDLNIASENEAYSEVVERFDRFEAFLAKYCPVE